MSDREAGQQRLGRARASDGVCGRGRHVRLCGAVQPRPQQQLPDEVRRLRHAGRGPGRRGRGSDRRLARLAQLASSRARSCARCMCPPLARPPDHTRTYVWLQRRHARLDGQPVRAQPRGVQPVPLPCRAIAGSTCRCGMAATTPHKSLRHLPVTGAAAGRHQLRHARVQARPPGAARTRHSATSSTRPRTSSHRSRRAPAPILAAFRVHLVNTANTASPLVQRGQHRPRAAAQTLHAGRADDPLLRRAGAPRRRSDAHRAAADPVRGREGGRQPWRGDLHRCPTRASRI